MGKNYRTLTVEELSSVLDYNPKTGALKWKSGEKADRPHPNGYLRVNVCGVGLLAHRLAWFLTYGYWPKEIDHINHDKADNRIRNLRECTRSENQCSRRKYQSASPLKGAHKFRDKWKAQIRFAGHQIYLGVFKTDHEAHAAYWQAASLMHGDFANKD
jgi:hypothetical protein